MGKHVVLTVHGVGEQTPGDTVDQVVTGALAEAARLGAHHPRAQGVHAQRIMTPDPSDPTRTPHVSGSVFALPDAPFATQEADSARDKQPSAQGFPVHTRHVTPAGSEDAVTFAEVYWADLSPAPKGAMATLFDLARVLLGIGYLALENVKDTGGTLSKGIVRAFTAVFFGMIAPINALMLIGTVVLFFEGTLYHVDPLRFDATESREIFLISPFWPLMVTSLITLCIGVLLRSRCNTYMVRCFSTGLAAMGMGSAVLVVLLTYAPVRTECAIHALDRAISGSWFTEADKAGLEPQVCGAETELPSEVVDPVTVPADDVTPPEAEAPDAAPLIGTEKPPQPDESATPQSDPDEEPTPAFLTVEALIVALLSLMALVWFLGLVLTLLSYVGWALDHLRTKDRRQGSTRRFFAPVLSGITVLWLGAVAVFWLMTHYAILKYHDIPYSTRKGKIPGTDSILPEILQDRLRDGLSVLPVMGLVLLVVVMTTAAVFSLRAVFHARVHQCHPSISRVLFNPVLQGALALGTAYVLVWILWKQVMAFPETPWIALLMGDTTNRTDAIFETVALVFVFVGLIVLNLIDKLGAILGIVRDIVSYAVVRRVRWDDAENVDAVRGGPLTTRQNYLIRDKIENRFERVLDHVLAVYQPDQLTIIAHSHGTVVAARGLNQWLKIGRTLPKTRFLTMGSPLSHIYQTYFPTGFGVPMLVPSKVTWHHFYRSADFAGSTIDPPNTAINHFIGPGGHTGYFTDPRLWRSLTEEASFRLF